MRRRNTSRRLKSPPRRSQLLKKRLNRPRTKLRKAKRNLSHRRR